MLSPSKGAIVAAATLMLLLVSSPHARPSPRRVEMGYLYHESGRTPELPNALLKKLQVAEASAGIGVEGSGASSEMMGGQRQDGGARLKQGRLQALARGNRSLSSKFPRLCARACVCLQTLTRAVADQPATQWLVPPRNGRRKRGWCWCWDANCDRSYTFSF